ncbi:MAG: SurA N-terminal domain-containing protein [Acidobacteriota bacterium]
MSKRSVLLLAVALIFSSLVLPSASAQGGEELLDRVVAMVDSEPILWSEIEELIGLGLVAVQEGESEDALRRRVLDQLVEERLRSQAVERFGFEQAPVAVIEEQVAEIRGRFESEEEFDRRLAAVGFSEAELRQLVAKQLAVLTYVEERLGAQVFVDLDEIRRYYDNVFAPSVTAQGQEVPPLDDVREDLRRVLRESQLNEEIVRWTEELRNNADVSVFYDEPRELPPVVDRVD